MLIRQSTALAVCVVVLTLGCEGAVSTVPQAVTLSGKTMGTTYSIKCWSEAPWSESNTLQADVDTLLAEINQQMSTYLPDSEISQFNVAPAGEWFAVSAETALVAGHALHYYKITDGASDVTVGPLVKLWDFGPGRHAIGARLKPPSDELLASTKAKTGGGHFEARLDPPALRKAIEHLEVDFSSLAKGFAVDKVSHLLKTNSFAHHMVEIGGEVRASGTRVDGKPWRIGVEVPGAGQHALHQVISLQNKALATSGDYRNFRVVDEKRVSHIIDPRTGRPLPYRGWSVTVIASSCMEADALATALLVLGEDRGYNWCEKHGVAAQFLIRQDRKVVEKSTPRFVKLTH